MVTRLTELAELAEEASRLACRVREAVQIQLGEWQRLV